MFHPRRSRPILAALLGFLAAACIAAAPARAAGFAAPGHAAPSGFALAQLWSWAETWLAAALPSPFGQSTASCDHGVSVDPNGGCVTGAAVQPQSSPVGQETASCDRGSSIDPNGGCSH